MGKRSRSPHTTLDAPEADHHGTEIAIIGKGLESVVLLGRHASGPTMLVGPHPARNLRWSATERPITHPKPRAFDKGRPGRYV